MDYNRKTTEEIYLLIENNLGLANKIASNKKRSMPRYVTFEELQSAAFLGLTEAANRFKPELGFCFTTYAYPRIAGAINDYLRQLGCGLTSLDDDDNKTCLKDTLVSHNTESSETFAFFEEVLGEQAGDMLRSYYVDRSSLKEIGQIYSVSEGRVSQLISGYRRTIRDKYQMADIAA